MSDKSTFQLDVQDLLNAKDELLMSAQRELAIAVARGNAMIRQIATLEARIAELEKTLPAQNETS